MSPGGCPRRRFPIGCHRGRRRTLCRRVLGFAGVGGSSDPALTPPLAWPGRYSPEQLATAVQVVRRMVQRCRSGGLREAVPDYCTPVWIQEADPVADAAEEFLASWRASDEPGSAQGLNRGS
jgi:hypothetical protein